MTNWPDGNWMDSVRGNYREVRFWAWGLAMTSDGRGQDGNKGGEVGKLSLGMAQEGLTKDFGDLGGGAAAWLNGVSRKRKVGLQYVCLIGGFF